MTFLLIILSISQIISFYLIYKINRKKTPKEVNGIVLPNIPPCVTYEDVDKDCKLYKDVMESITLEDWEVEVKRDDYYDVKFTSSYGIIFEIKVGLGYISKSNPNPPPYIRNSFIRSSDGFVHTSDSNVKNDILIFSWDYIIKYHEDINKHRHDNYVNTIREMGSKLKTLNRNKKLNDIIE